MSGFLRGRHRPPRARPATAKRQGLPDPGRKQLVQQSPIFVAAAVTSLEEINDGTVSLVTAGTARDPTSTEELLVELNRAGYSGAVSIKWEENDVDQQAGARLALTNVHHADQPPSAIRHDEQLVA